MSPEERIKQLDEALRACIPWVATSGRGMAQEALALACEATGQDPYDWTAHPEVLTRRRVLLGMPDRRKGPRTERRVSPNKPASAQAPPPSGEGLSDWSQPHLSH